MTGLTPTCHCGRMNRLKTSRRPYHFMDKFVTTSPTPASPAVNATELPSLFKLLGYATQVLGRFFPMVYPIFGYFVLTSFLIPQGSVSVEHWGLWTVYIGIFLMMFLFKAGWNAVIFEACQSWMRQTGVIKKTGAGLLSENTETQSVSFFESFKILGAFLPGLGAYGLDYLLGCLLETLLLVLPFALMAWVAYQFVGFPSQYIEGMYKIIETALSSGQTLDQEKMSALVYGLSDSESTKVVGCFALLLLGGLLSLFIQIVTVYWEPIVRRDNCNAFRAFFRSAKIAFKQPFSTFLIWFYFNTCFVFLSLLMATNEWGMVIGNFVNILFIALLACYLYLYLHFYVSPVIEEVEVKPEQPYDGSI